MRKVIPVEAIPPGELIQEELDARGWTQSDLASITGLSRRQIINLISGTSAITPDSAQLLAQALDVDAGMIMNMQVTYELALAATKDRSVARRAAAFSKVPVRDMIKRGWIADQDDPDQLCVEVCKFLGISAISDAPVMNWAARKSDSYAMTSPAQIAWYFRARQLAENVDAVMYKDSQFMPALEALRALCGSREDIRRVPNVLAEHGIRLVVVEHLPRAKVDGATFWLNESSPCIALSLRYDRIDNFWFTLMHEMDHVRHRDESVDVELAEAIDAELPENEQRANAAAAEYLIPREKIESFIRRTRPLYYQKRVVQFANSRGIHPGIVVGQLHRRREIVYSQLRGLLEKVRDVIVGQAITDGWGDCPIPPLENSGD